jgi:hypothetical protein
MPFFRRITLSRFWAWGGEPSGRAGRRGGVSQAGRSAELEVSRWEGELSGKRGGQPSGRSAGGKVSRAEGQPRGEPAGR